MLDHGCDQLVTVLAGQAEVTVDGLGGTHHEAGVVDAELSHHPPDVVGRRPVIEVAQVLRIDAAAVEQVAGAAALRAARVEPDADLHLSHGPRPSKARA
jgi:hypothetical protein